LPDRVPKVPELPDWAAFVSVQEAAERLKLLLAFSVKVTAVVMLLTAT